MELKNKEQAVKKAYIEEGGSERPLVTSSDV